MNKFKEYLQSHTKLVKLFILGYIVFASCCTFPFGNERFPFDFMKACLVISTYGSIGLGLAGFYGAKKEKLLYTITLGLTALGMLVRYFIKFGEVSNTWNFTYYNTGRVIYNGFKRNYV